MPQSPDRSLSVGYGSGERAEDNNHPKGDVERKVGAPDMVDCDVVVRFAGREGDDTSMDSERSEERAYSVDGEEREIDRTANEK